MEEKRKKRRGWRATVERVNQGREYPRAVLCGLGLLIPAGLVTGALHAFITGEARVPARRGPGILRGAEAVGFGMGLLGLAIVVHSYIFWRSNARLRPLAFSAMLVGFLTIAASVVVTFS